MTKPPPARPPQTTCAPVSKMHFQIHFDICCCSTNLNHFATFCKVCPPPFLPPCLEEQKLCRLSHFSNLQFLFDEMTCGTEWNWDFLQTSQRQFWMNKIYSDNGLSGLDRIFDIWHQSDRFNSKFGQYQQWWPLFSQLYWMMGKKKLKVAS